MSLLDGGRQEAAETALPNLLKAAAAVLLVLMLTPFLILAALPNTLFGYKNAKDGEIIALTDKAYSIDAAYQSVSTYNREAVKKIIEKAKADHTIDGTASFDTVTVNEDFGNTNMYWLIAITSVAHQQNLFLMDEESIKQMTANKLVYTASITPSGSPAAMVLTIDIRDLNPEELMDSLAFSDEERNWAGLLFDSMTENQYLARAESDGAGLYGTDYGDITFTDTATPVVYYNQTDARWGGEAYGKTGTIATSACGPAALAMVVASLTDKPVTPPDVARWAAENGYRAEGNGSYLSLMPDGGAHYGLFVEGIGLDSKKLVEALSEGKLVIALMSKGHFTSGGHFIVIRGVTAEGDLLVADSASYERSAKTWSLRLVAGEASRKAASGGPFWVFSR